MFKAWAWAWTFAQREGWIRIEWGLGRFHGCTLPWAASTCKAPYDLRAVLRFRPGDFLFKVGFQFGDRSPWALTFSMLRETHISLMENNVSQNRKIKSLETRWAFPFARIHPFRP